MKALTHDELKELLRFAYHEGKLEKERNEKRDKLIEEGTKQAPEEASFDSFFFSLMCKLKA